MRQHDDGAISDEQRKAADAGAKPLMPIAGRPFIDYVLNSLADAGVTQVALVVAPDHETVRQRYLIDAPPERLTIDFVVQAEPTGTATAVLAAEGWTLGEPFLTVNGDNLYPVTVLRDLVDAGEPACAVFPRDELVASGNIPADRVKHFAIVEVGPDGYLRAIVEKPSEAQVSSATPSVGISMNCWRLDSQIFEFCREVPASSRGEYELPQAVGLAIAHGVKVRALRASGAVLDLSRRADVASVERILSGVLVRL
jgi:glucose-1-phosphate thymidylyltransferase